MNQTSALSPVTEDYGAAQIQILEGLEAVAQAPQHVHRQHVLTGASPHGI